MDDRGNIRMIPECEEPKMNNAANLRFADATLENIRPLGLAVECPKCREAFVVWQAKVEESEK